MPYDKLAVQVCISPLKSPLAQRFPKLHQLHRDQSISRPGVVVSGVRSASQVQLEGEVQIQMVASRFNLHLHVFYWRVRHVHFHISPK
jgi:hypothetical protein